MPTAEVALFSYNKLFLTVSHKSHISHSANKDKKEKKMEEHSVLPAEKHSDPL